MKLLFGMDISADGTHLYGEGLSLPTVLTSGNSKMSIHPMITSHQHYQARQGVKNTVVGESSGASKEKKVKTRKV